MKKERRKKERRGETIHTANQRTKRRGGGCAGKKNMDKGSAVGARCWSRLCYCDPITIDSVCEGAVTENSMMILSSSTLAFSSVWEVKLQHQAR